MDGGAITVGERAKREERKHVLSAAVVCWCEGQNEHMMCLEWESWRRIGTEHMSEDETMDPLSCRGDWTEGKWTPLWALSLAR